MRKPHLLSLSLAVGLLLVPVAAGSDSHEPATKPLTWVSYVKAQTGQGGPLGMHMAEGGKKIYDPLMADGHIITWGVGQPINHNPGDEWTHMEWVTFRDWAAVDVFIRAFMAAQGAKSPEELAAEQEKWYSLVVPGSHFDTIYRHAVLHPADGGRPAYFNLSFHTANPLGAEAFQKLFDEYATPVLTKLQQAGSIGGFGLAGEAVHGGWGGTHVFWYSMPGLAAQDAVEAGFAAAAAERGAEAQQEVMAKFAEAVDFEAHHDRVIAVTHYGGGDGGGGDDDDGGDGGE